MLLKLRSSKPEAVSSMRATAISTTTNVADAVEEVGAEGSVFNFLLQLAICRAHDAHFNFLLFLRTDAAELAILEQLQQLRLEGQVQSRGIRCRDAPFLRGRVSFHRRR